MYTIPLIPNEAACPLPVLGLGTWGMGGHAVRDPKNDDERDIESIRSAIQNGITHIDTAELYASSHTETLVSQALKSAAREKLLLASKVQGNHLAHDDVLKACEGSLKRLGTDYLDLYYVHWRNPTIPQKETAKAFNALLKDGRIKHVGVCNYTPDSMKEFQSHLNAPIAVNQSHYNLVFREPERKGLLAHCESVKATFLAWRPIMWSKEHRPDLPAGNAWDREIFPLLDQIANDYGKPNVQVAVNWLINQPNVATLVKSSSHTHLKEILECLSWHLKPQDIERLRKDFPNQQDTSCTVPLA